LNKSIFKITDEKKEILKLNLSKVLFKPDNKCNLIYAQLKCYSQRSQAWKFISNIESHTESRRLWISSVVLI